MTSVVTIWIKSTTQLSGHRGWSRLPTGSGSQLMIWLHFILKFDLIWAHAFESVEDIFRRRFGWSSCLRSSITDSDQLCPPSRFCSPSPPQSILKPLTDQRNQNGVLLDHPQLSVSNGLHFGAENVFPGQQLEPLDSKQEFAGLP